MAIERRQKNEAEIAFSEVVAQDWQAMEAACKTHLETTVEIAQLALKLGSNIEAWMNKSQMRFEEFEDWFRQHEDKLPKKLNSAAAHKLLKAHRQFPGGARDYRAAEQVCQLTFYATGLLPEPKRVEAQLATGRGPFESFITLFPKQREAFERLRAAVPEEKWTPKMWQDIVHETAEAHELHEKALARLRAAGARKPYKD